VKETDLLRELMAQDRTTLEGGDEYMAYFRYLQGVFERLLRFLREQNGASDPLEIGILQQFAGQFLHTVECLRLKYLCEPERKLRYDPTDSSFPSFIEFQELEHDLNVREQMLRELPSVEALRQAILDAVFRHAAVPEPLLRQLGQREYYLLLSRYARLGGLFREFSPGNWKLLEGEADAAPRYLFAWGSYDALSNRPHVYMLILEQRSKAPRPLAKVPDKAGQIEALIRKTSGNTVPLQVIARDLDEALDDFSPKVLKRIELGPLYGRYSRDEHPYSLLLKQHFGPEDLIFLFTTEIVFSIGETKTKGLLSGGQLRQVFFVNKTSRETLERNVSEVNAYMMANHEVVQYLHDRHPEALRGLALPPILYTAAQAGSDAKK
jgi:hypothetical protein